MNILSIQQEQDYHMTVGRVITHFDVGDTPTREEVREIAMQYTSDMDVIDCTARSIARHFADNA